MFPNGRCQFKREAWFVDAHIGLKFDGIVLQLGNIIMIINK